MLPASFDRMKKEVIEINQKWHFDENGNPLPLDTERRERCVLLILSELFEAFEGVRKPNLMDSHLAEFKAEHVEMMDVLIRLIDFIHFMENDNTICPDMFSYIQEPTSKIKDMTYMNSIINTLMVKNNAISVIEVLISYFEKYNIDYETIFWQKSNYNRNRKDHSREARNNGGKQF